MTKDETTPSPPPSPNEIEPTECGQGLFFNTATLSRFMRACYGADAAKEAQRHVAEYSEAADSELVEIWKRVVAHLHGVELKEDSRRTVKAAKSFKVRS